MWNQSLCTHCKYLRVIRNERGSHFYLCQKSKDFPFFAKYPPQPVLQCVGFELKVKDENS